jgi:hypothetical protein
MGGSLTDDFQPSAACKFLDLLNNSPAEISQNPAGGALYLPVTSVREVNGNAPPLSTQAQLSVIE